MEIKILGNNHSILDHYLSEIRDEVIQKDPLRFRENMYRIGEIFAYEISKTLHFEVSDIKTPLGVAKVPTLRSQPKTVLFRLTVNIPRVGSSKSNLNIWLLHH